MLDEDEPSNAKGRHDADIETPIAVQEAGPFTIPHKSLKARNKTNIATSHSIPESTGDSTIHDERSLRMA
jgi:hypothetical protein